MCIDNLHATRLLQVEERPFSRVTKNLLGPKTLLKVRPKQLPTPPPDGEEAPTEPAESDEDIAFKRQKFREDILLDFSSLESSILRIQLLQNSNERERQRYASEKAKITETATAVKENTVALRAQLVEAQQVLELRKGYDQLAKKLIKDSMKPRSETRMEIEKLEKEIEDLRQESGDFDGVWAARREAFDRVVAEGQNAINLIRGIKDEPELDKDERMEDGDDEETQEKQDRSRMGTPAPEAGTPMPGGSTPIPGGETPMPESGEIVGASSPRPVNKFLDVEDTTRGNSRVGSPRMDAKDPAGDVQMGDDDELEAKAKTTAGMEATDNQVTTPAAPIGAEGEAMDET